MISIIVSSHKEHFYKRFAANVCETIGVAYEIVKIENHGEMGLCKAYNIGAKKAAFPYLCFCHEDILFKTNNWGVTVINYFKNDPRLGLVGVAGSDYKTIAPSSFYCSDENRVFMHIIQSPEKSSSESFNLNPTNQTLADVVCADGVWLFTNKEVFAQIRFDEHTFHNFHCYDVDFSLSVFKNYKVAITSEVLIEHFSEGSFDKGWIEETLKLFSKWKNSLPLSVRPYPDPKPIKLEVKTLVDFFISMYENSFSPFRMIEIYQLVSPSIPFRWKDKLYLKYVLLKQFIKFVLNRRPVKVYSNY